MEPQITQNTQMDTCEDRINLLSKRSIGCGRLCSMCWELDLLRKLMITHWCTSSAKLDSPSRNNKAIDEIHLAASLPATQLRHASA
jgi:hypothetical protein